MCKEKKNFFLILGIVWNLLLLILKTKKLAPKTVYIGNLL